MLGLCHNCLSSGVTVNVTKGRVHCEKSGCIEGKKPGPLPFKYQEKLPFEDLPQGDPKTRHQHAEKVLIEKFDKELLEKIALDRLLDKD
jgi:hypothetical protein